LVKRRFVTVNNFTKIACFLSIFFFIENPMIAHESTVKINFYGQEVDLTYDDNIAKVFGTRYGEKQFTDFLKEKETTNYQNLLQQLQVLKQDMNLNDWMYFELMHNCIDHILKAGNDYEKNLFTHLLLSKGGYDSKITFMNHKTWVNVYTEDQLYEISTILLGNKNFVSSIPGLPIRL